MYLSNSPIVCNYVNKNNADNWANMFFSHLLFLQPHLNPLAPRRPISATKTSLYIPRRPISAAKKSIPRQPISAACETSFLDRSQRRLLINFGTITGFPGARRSLVLNSCGFYISWCTKLAKFFTWIWGRDWLFTELWTMAFYSAYMMYSRHSSLAQLFGGDSDGFRSGLEIVRTWKFVVE
jgi:hypothetical protein